MLSTAAVTVVNQLEIEQQSAYQIYIPMFIGIYIVSRWLDSRFNQASSQQTSQETQPNTMQDKTSLQERHFSTKCVELQTSFTNMFA